jgi:hypothetical protein
MYYPDNTGAFPVLDIIRFYIIHVFICIMYSLTLVACALHGHGNVRVCMCALSVHVDVCMHVRCVHVNVCM